MLSMQCCTDESGNPKRNEWKRLHTACENAAVPPGLAEDQVKSVWVGGTGCEPLLRNGLCSRWRDIYSRGHRETMQRNAGGL